MEPLDPKAELMRLADLYALDLANCDFIPDEINKVAKNTSRAVLESAITLALTAERRRAIEEAMAACKEADHKLTIGGLYDIVQASECIAAIRALIDGKAGST